MRTFADFSNQLLALKETLKKEDIANVAGDGAVSMPPTAKKVKKRKDGQITRRVLLGARMAVRKEEQRVRPRVREPNAFVRGKRQRYREARI